MERRIEDIPGTESLKSLISHTYAYRMFDKEMRKFEFEFLSRLVAEVPVRSLTPFAGLNRLSELCGMVIEDVRGRPSEPQIG